MTYVPHTQAEQAQMLARIGVRRVEDLFESVPPQLRFPTVELPAPLSEVEILRELNKKAVRNVTTEQVPWFLGAGAYRHFIPAVVDQLVSRAEFYTAYTPYQPEVSQGTLQAMFEYQSMICALTGMEVSNASHYDGATAMAEAVIMAVSAGRGKRRKVVIGPGVHPEYRETVGTYTQGMGITFVGDRRLRITQAELVGLVDDETACLIVQNPDFFGHILDLGGVADQVHAKGTLLVVACNPISLGMLNPPGAYGADIALGEGQPLGNPLNYGGPYLGYFACRQEHVRRMAGRLVGRAHDAKGNDGYVLTLSTREQHIRRERATSNICTNQGLNALTAAVYLAAMGKCGLSKVASMCYHKAHYLAEKIDAVSGFKVERQQPFFNEFVVRCPMPASELGAILMSEYSIQGGYDLGLAFPRLSDRMLMCVTELNTRVELNELAEVLEEVTR